MRVEHCAFDWTHHANRNEGEGDGTGTGGTAVLEFPSCGRTIGKGSGGDEDELSTATMVTIGPEAPHRTALHNFEKGNYRRVGKWCNTLVSTDHYVESKPPRAATAPSDVETQREHRDRESRECIGGMRSPWRSVRRMPAARTVGARIKRTIEKYIDHHPDVVQILARLGDKEFAAANTQSQMWLNEHVGNLRQQLVIELGGILDIQGADAGSWHAPLVVAHMHASGDPDQDLPRWVTEGAPVGVAKDITDGGIFPLAPTDARPVNEVSEILTLTEPISNYKSVEDAREIAAAEIDRAVKMGFAKHYDSWDELLRGEGQVVIAKLACNIKLKPDLTRKVRMIADLRRNGYNRFVRYAERIVLPRLTEVLEDAADLDECLVAGEILSHLSCDFADAFHNFAVHPTERRFLAAKHPCSGYVVYYTILFGGGGCPLVWGRGSAYLGRSGQSLFDERKARVQLYVDDPIVTFREVRRTQSPQRVGSLVVVGVFGTAHLVG